MGSPVSTRRSLDQFEIIQLTQYLRDPRLGHSSLLCKRRRADPAIFAAAEPYENANDCEAPRAAWQGSPLGHHATSVSALAEQQTLGPQVEVSLSVCPRPASPGQDHSQGLRDERSDHQRMPSFRQLTPCPLEALYLVRIRRSFLNLDGKSRG